MTLRELSSIIERLIDGYGEDCLVASFVRKDEVLTNPTIWYDEDEDVVFIH